MINWSMSNITIVITIGLPLLLSSSEIGWNAVTEVRSVEFCVGLKCHNLPVAGLHIYIVVVQAVPGNKMPMKFEKIVLNVILSDIR